MRLTVLGIALASLALPAVGDDPVSEGRPAPSFYLPTLNADVCGATLVDLDRLVGERAEDAGARAVLVSFFGSWCEPCKRELPLLVRLDREYRDRGLRVLSVDLDQDDAGIAAPSRRPADARVIHPVLSDRTRFLALSYLGNEFPLPSVVIVRRDGTIARIERGYGKDASGFLAQEVRSALGMSPSPTPPAEGADPKRPGRKR